MDNHVRSPKLAALMSEGRIRRLRKGGHISDADVRSGILLVLEGYVKRYRINSDGSLGTQIVYGPQDVFSLTEVFRSTLGQSIYDGPETYYYTAMSDVRLSYLGREELHLAVKSDLSLYRDLFAEAGQHLKTCIHNIENMSLNRMPTRVAHQLLFLARQFGYEGDEGTCIQLPLTHQDIADMLGTTRRTVTMAMGELRRQGLVLDKRPITVPDIGKLETRAYAA